MSDTADTGGLDPVRRLSGRGEVFQRDDELCRVTFELLEFERSAAAPIRHFEGTLTMAGGIPVDVGMPDLVLELADGRRIDIQITGVSSTGRRETYLVRGNPVASVHANTQ